ncbi:DNA metabolism protein [Lithospermum erythrorhizon]|uniref:DNA metabolism protein n=1 Tax=Lithospermum erythrorhizon TaxID=34254 RepID=A0AAV3Q909_LITER
MDPRHAWYSRPPIPPYAAAPPAPPNPYPPPPTNAYAAAPPVPTNPYPVAPPFQAQYYYQTTPPPPPLPHQPPPPPPPPPHDPYDPFTDHRPMMPFNSIPNPPEYLNPSFNNYAHAGVKRMRVDEFESGQGRVSNLDRNINNNNNNIINNNVSFGVSNDDERRLKLIREHGGSGVSDSRNGFELSSCGTFDKGNFRNFGFSNVDKRESVYDQGLEYNTPKRYCGVNDRAYEVGNVMYDGYGNVNGDGNNSGSGQMGTSGRMNGGYYDSINRFGSEKSNLDGHGMEVKSVHYGSPYRNEQGGINRLHNQSSQVLHSLPFSASPSPPLPAPRAVEPFKSRLPESMVSTSPSPSGGTVFPNSAGSDALKVAAYPPLPEAYPFSSTYPPNKGIQTIHHEFPKTYQRESEQFPSQYSTPDVHKIVDASLLLKHPHRTTRPDHIVIIFRGLPGSGKSYLAKMLRDLEVENGGKAPRIHTMDDYFMMEVEKIEESEGSKSSSSVRGRKPATKIVMEYCYEPEMEEAYRSSMLKAFKKTLDEGVYSFVIVDDRNLRVADFVQFWATAKRSGYEVYLLEAAYKDPAGCAARNIHGFTQDDIRKMADQWEEAPSMYLQLDIRSLLHGDKLLDSEIEEVDMDTGEGDPTCVPLCSDESNAGRVGAHSSSNGPHRDDKKHDATGPPYQKEDGSKELGNSKWSNDLDEDDSPSTHVRERNLNTLPGLNQSCRKKGKSVHWGDKVANAGFSIGAAKMAYMSSLVIGPGSGYNLNTNPMAEADKTALRQNTGKMQNILREQLRAEHESFKAVFDKLRQPIGGFDLDEE